MNRDKVLELAREGGLVHQWQTQGEQHDILKTLERFAALIEREVRGDAEAHIHSCSYYCTRPECIRAQRDELRDKIESATVSDAKPALWLTKDGLKTALGEENQTGFRVSASAPEDYVPLYTHPTPAVVAQFSRLTEDDLDRIYMRFVEHELAPRLFDDIAGCVEQAMIDKAAPTPAVVQQLVDSAAKMVNVLDAEPLTASWVKTQRDELKAALAAAKEAGL